MSVLVYTENTEGLFKKAVFELVSFAKALADQLSKQVVAVTIGEVADDELSKLGTYGASKVVKASIEGCTSFNPQAYVPTLQKIADKEAATHILFQNNYNGHALSPRLAARLKAGLVTGVLALPKSYQPFVVRRKVYSGKAFADIELKSEVKIMALNANSFAINENPVQPTIETYNDTVSDASQKLKVESVDRVKGKVPVTEAELIVSGGRGLKGPENWTLVEKLAELIGASTACSKPVADIEWRPHEEHVGQTGKFVSPNLYIAIGISGAIQHLAGISSSKVIVAINNDPEAPIFEAADYGIVGDAFDVVPKFTEAVRAIKSN